MKIRQATQANRSVLLALMREAHQDDDSDTPGEWANTEAAMIILVDDPQAGEAHLILDDDDEPVGYAITCRDFRPDYGGYYNYVYESWVRESGRERFRDQRFSS